MTGMLPEMIGKHSESDWKLLDGIEEEKALKNFIRHKFNNLNDVFNALKK